MIAKLKLLVVVLLFSSTTFGQTLWTKISEKEINKNEVRDRSTIPSSYHLFSLDLNVMKQVLQNAPLNELNGNNQTQLSFPDSEGLLATFTVCEAPIMEAGLQVKFPHLKSYTAKGIDNPRTTLRFSITDFGLHAMSVTNEKGTYFIDSYTKDSSKYIVYYKKDCTATEKFNCNADPSGFTPKIKNKSNQSALSNDGIFRQYRMALTADTDYSQFHIDAAGVTNGTVAQQKSAVLSAMAVMMTRVNGIFERDLGIRLNLVANNDLLILIGPTPYFTEADFSNENIAFTDATIGHTNYDIGHMVCTIGYNMGVAALCAFDKAAGSTGSYTPVGDPFVIDYFSHEVGHQFGAGHTFYSTCGDMADESVSVEPGGGTTIMSYAGICSPVVQNHADAYFSTATILQIQDFINQPERNCFTSTPSGSNAPEIEPLNNYTIPKGTPFLLKGNATASNQSALTYCWEQIDIDSPYDNAQPQPPLSTNILGPNFRSFPPISSPDRYFPSFSSVMQGKLYPKWEVISDVARTMKFAFTVRDNNLINGGQTQTAISEIYVSEVGPFKITSPNQVNTYFPSGVAHYLTWDVAGTTENGIDTETVTVSISTDNGVTFTPLVSNTLNDGAEWIQFPNVESAYCRIMITPDNSVYYALTPNFSLGQKITTTCSNYTNTANATIPLVYDNGGYTDITINVPHSRIISDVNFFATINHAQFHQCEMYLSSPTNPTDFVHLNNGFCYGLDGQLKLKFDDDGMDINCEGPPTVLQTIVPNQPLSAFIGQNQEGNWTLRVKDTWEGDDGTITLWNLNICGEEANKICAPVVASTGITKTYTGGTNGWSPSPPNENDPVIISVNGSPNSFVCNSLDLNGKTISITGTRTIEVVNDITGTGTINIATAASLLQRNDYSVIEPAIILDKRTRTNMRALDYIYWGSPLTNTPLSILDNAIAVSGGGVAGAFDSKYKYVAGDLTSTGGWQPLDAISPGKGFITRIKQATPFATLNIPVNIRIKQIFQGVANNGIITVPVAVTENLLSARNNNLLSNPYPSAIDANTFLAYNPILDGVIYLWKAQTPATSVGYAIADYIAYTRAGATASAEIGETPFDGMIATGQGFKVRALDNGVVEFNNCMRVTGNNGQFMRESFRNTSSPSQVNRYKLNLIDSNGNGNQILVAYLPETTLGYDRMYDAELMAISNTKIYSFLDNSTKKLAINARPDFEITDVVKLGMSKTETTSENFTISIVEKEGVFADTAIAVYVHDMEQNVYHNLAIGGYNFTENTNTVNERFRVVYQNSTLNNQEIEPYDVKATINHENLIIRSNFPITNVSVFDVSARLISNVKVNNENIVNSAFNFAEGIYIAKIKMTNGVIATKKLINHK